MNIECADVVLEGRKILIVDDEPDLREVLSARFEMEGCEVSIAENGQAALALMKIDHFDVVISDIRMPGGNGLDLLKAIQTKRPTPAVILISGFSDIDESEILKNGASAILVKPFDLEDLVHAICRALGDNQFNHQELKC